MKVAGSPGWERRSSTWNCCVSAVTGGAAGASVGAGGRVAIGGEAAGGTVAEGAEPHADATRMETDIAANVLIEWLQWGGRGWHGDWTARRLLKTFETGSRQKPETARRALHSSSAQINPAEAGRAQSRGISMRRLVRQGPHGFWISAQVAVVQARGLGSRTLRQRRVAGRGCRCWTRSSRTRRSVVAEGGSPGAGRGEKL